ncbi:hypothetical protein MMC18_006888 [Xylographa bjoerkii]|nr:hypothetical protein [Xylographa bjoerkii]
MSPRTDSYLSLCLEQASKSTLHYRHGCVIVSGGKVIGNGYNHYRPGYNGGALKTGKLAACGALNSPAILALKQKQKQKQTPKSTQCHEGAFVENTYEKEPEAASTSSFARFEIPALDCSGGGGHLANTPLSMHSEMMAPPALRGGWLNRALNYRVVVNGSSVYKASKRTSRPSAVSLPALSKRHVANDAVVGLRFKGRALKGLHLNAVKNKEFNENNGKNGNNGNNAEIKEEGEKNEEKVRLPLWKSAETVCGQKQYGYQCEGTHQGPIHHHQSELQQHGQQHASSRPKDKGPAISNLCSSISAQKAQPTTKGNTKQTVRCMPLKPLPDGHPSSRPTGDHLKNSSTLLLRARTGAKSHTVTDRMKNSRLRGADLYVARLGWKKSNRSVVVPTEPSNPDDAENPVIQATGTVPKPEPVRPTGSLHDELRLPAHSPPSDVRIPAVERPCVSASRPCYRCICYMHTVGIKRVFWTNEKGDWEGCKVRNMMDALDLSGSKSENGTRNGSTGGPAGNGVFVTKHEVLMLRRLMGV